MYSIFGLKRYSPDISLEEIKQFLLNDGYQIKNPQQKLSRNYLIELINNTIYSNKDNKRQPVNSDFINSNQFLSDLIPTLKKLNIDKLPGYNKPIPGHVYYDTNKEKGFSLQVFSPKGSGKKISLLNISAGRSQINFQSDRKYRIYLEHKPDKCERWMDFLINELRLPIKTIKQNGSISLPIDIVHKNIANLVLRINDLV